MSKTEQVITEEPQPQASPGIQQPLPGQYPPEFPPPSQPMMQPSQPGQPMMQQGMGQDTGCTGQGFYAICCGEMLLMDISRRLGEGTCFACCCPNALLSLRIKFRTEQNIQGSLWDDYVTVYCCGSLALCQLARELDHVQRTQRV